VVTTAASMDDMQGAQGRPGTEVVRPSIPVRVTVYARWALITKP
jgi:hypothetical protein